MLIHPQYSPLGIDHLTQGFSIFFYKCTPGGRTQSRGGEVACSQTWSGGGGAGGTWRRGGTMGWWVAALPLPCASLSPTSSWPGGACTAHRLMVLPSHHPGPAPRKPQHRVVGGGILSPPTCVYPLEPSQVPPGGYTYPRLTTTDLTQSSGLVTFIIII